MKLRHKLQPQGPLPLAGQAVGAAAAQPLLGFTLAQALLGIHAKTLQQPLCVDAMGSALL
jgi:hypothetical protein